MARVVIHEGKGPVEVKAGTESAWVCGCGLSTNKPHCSGAHKQVVDEEEGKLYAYENGKRFEVSVEKK